MKPTPKALGWILLLLVLLWLGRSGSLDWTGNGNFDLTINGHPVEGPAKFVLAPVAAVLGAVAGLLGLIVGVIAIAGSGLLILAVLLLVALVFVGLSLPFMMPLAVPLAVIFAVILATRHTKPALNAPALPPRLN
jgi:hypothetical protein